MLLVFSFFVEFLASLDVDVSVFNTSTFFPVGPISNQCQMRRFVQKINSPSTDL
jgi:hypothetical protein